MILGEILKIINFYHFDSDPRFPPFLLLLGGNLGSLLYGDVSVMSEIRGGILPSVWDRIPQSGSIIKVCHEATPVVIRDSYH